jgi:superfamily II DNA or RNA helicase
MNLRDYQLDIISQLNHQWQHHDRVMVQLPTGGGKSLIFGAVAKQAIDQGQRILLLAHREELIIQAAGHLAHWCEGSSGLAGMTGAMIGIVKCGYPLHQDRPIQVASVASLAGRRSRLGQFDLVVIDEAHHATAKTYRAALGSCQDAKLLGLTATPIRLDGSGFDDIFDSLVTGISTAELIDQGHLSRFKYFADAKPMITKGVKSTGGDFSSSSLVKANDLIELSGNLINSYRRHSEGLRCVVFAINCQHSRDIAAAYNQAGIPAAHLDGESPADERSSTLEAFKRGDIKVLSNVALFDEGVDIPALEAVQIARPTKSLSKYLQICGRVLRIAKSKEYAIIIDHTDNWTIHGLPDNRRVWTLQGAEEPQERQLKRNLKTGEIEEQETIPVVAVPDRELIDLTTNRELASKVYWENCLQSLMDTAKNRGYKQGWLTYRLLEMKPPIEVWRSAAKQLGYAQGWAWHKYQESQQQDVA